MSIKDVIKKSVLESEMYNQAISLSTILTMTADLLLALVMGLLIYAVYKKFYKGGCFQQELCNHAGGDDGAYEYGDACDKHQHCHIPWHGGCALDCALSYSDKGAA